MSELIYENHAGYQAPEVFQIYYCKNCDTSFASPMNENHSVYEQIYKNSNTIPGYNRYWNYFNSIGTTSRPLNYLAKKEEAYWGVRQSLIKTVINKSENKILEIGSGLGYLTYALRKDGYDCSGLEISETAVNMATRKFGNFYICADINEYSVQNSASYDIIILTEVIEHLSDPFTFMRLSSKLLKSDGKIIVTTPNKSFYPAGYYWETDLPPVHFWWFSKKSMKILAEKMDMNIYFTDFTRFSLMNTKIVNLYHVQEFKLKQSVLSPKGDLLNTEISKNNSGLKIIKNFIFKIPYLKCLYLNLRNFSDPKLLVTGKNSVGLCMLFTKKTLIINTSAG